MTTAAVLTATAHDFRPVADEILVGGSRRRGAGPAFAVTDPSTGQTLQIVHQATAADVDDAVAAGRAAAADPAWRGMLPHERARYLHRIADAIDENTTRLAVLQSYNTGKTVTETTALVGSAAGTFRYFAAVLETADDALTTPRGSPV
ncbi:aldehyde dehydrogenase family protein, partial [Rhodococcus chondri]